jgi:two-component system response regulator HydG
VSGLADAEARLHAARPEDIEAVMVAIALEATGHVHGALFLWDRKARGLVLAHHVAHGLTLTLPQVVPTGRDRAGIAAHAFDQDEAYLCGDTSVDPRYTRYLLDVGSIAAVPIRYQKRPIEVERKIELAAPTRAPILVRGESGTGKDLVARAIHANSKRADKPYVTVNCAAIPETLLESILFGHVKGAFTGASFHKVGEFQKADGGTLFLDEVGELPVMLQAKVLRAVEQGEVQPLGSNDPPSRVDVRLICATNRDLEAMARIGTFRDDLFYRLSVMTLELPPLRSYKDCLEVMANVFVEQAARAHGKRAPRLGPAVLARLEAYDFPGNVRELKNAIEHAVILCAGDELSERDLPKPLLAAGPATTPAARRGDPTARATLRQLREVWLAPLEKRYLGELLAEHGGSVRKAARAAGIDAVTLYRLLRKRGVAVTRQVRTDD